MQNQTDSKHSSNPKDTFKSAQNFLEKPNPEENFSKTTISKFLSKTPNRRKTSKQQYNFYKDIISLEFHFRILWFFWNFFPCLF